MLRRWSTVILTVAVALSLGLVATNRELRQRVFLPFMAKQATPAATGKIEGKVNIGPLCPVEPCRGGTPDVYSSRYLLLQPERGDVMRIALRPDGSFHASVPATTYTVNLSDCTFLGCRFSLPKLVTIVAGQVTILNIDFDTGIR